MIMKQKNVITLLLLLSPFFCFVSCFGDFQLPSNSYEISELTEARKKAAAKNKPVAFFYTNKDSTYGLCQNANEIIVKELKSRTVLVYVRSKKDCPENISKALSRKGKYIPKVVVFGSGRKAMDTQLDILRNSELPEDDLIETVVAFVEAQAGSEKAGALCSSIEQFDMDTAVDFLEKIQKGE